MTTKTSCSLRLPRRAVLGLAATGIALGLPPLVGCAPAAELARGPAPPPTRPRPSPTPLADAGAPPGSPDEALAQLFAGNQRFAEGRALAPHRNLARLAEVASKQTPFAAFLGCADSRVPNEIVFDQGFGDIFVTRIAGNVADPTIIGSLEFGTLVLGAKVLFVLGHTSCGAVSATAKGDAVPGQISTLYQHIRPAVKSSGGDVGRAIVANVKNQMEVLAEASPVIVQLIKEGKVIVAGGVYDLSSGRVTPVKAG